MSPRLHLGSTEAGGDFTLPLELVTQTAAVVGIRGSGKTVTATVEVEEALKAGVPVVVIDPTDVWWGLKNSCWMEKLSNPQAAILFQVLENHPHPIPRQELAERSNQSPTSSGYANNLGKLRSLGLIDYPRAGEVAATDLLFPKGLR